ncbi:hypothetical protein DERF_000089 [Dermatophagoides farinae]|uniref:Uncharacterized protein n=1 Tax=Dermatophagoides farinae TaxID=6954 RepID=A0A922I5V3_DERFA|nr:hypothetical protein DERF_000089 [Dermatophagoides farinae]
MNECCDTLVLNSKNKTKKNQSPTSISRIKREIKTRKKNRFIHEKIETWRNNIPMIWNIVIIMMASQSLQIFCTAESVC